MGHVTLCKMCQKEVAPDKRADAIFAAMNAGYARTIARLGGETMSERATSAASPPVCRLAGCLRGAAAATSPRKRDRLPRRAVVGWEYLWFPMYRLVRMQRPVSEGGSISIGAGLK